MQKLLRSRENARPTLVKHLKAIDRGGNADVRLSCDVLNGAVVCLEDCLRVAQRDGRSRVARVRCAGDREPPDQKQSSPCLSR